MCKSNHDSRLFCLNASLCANQIRQQDQHFLRRRKEGDHLVERSLSPGRVELSISLPQSQIVLRVADHVDGDIRWHGDYWYTVPLYFNQPGTCWPSGSWCVQWMTPPSSFHSY